MQEANFQRWASRTSSPCVFVCALDTCAGGRRRACNDWGTCALCAIREVNAAAEEVIQLCGADRITEHSCQTQIRKMHMQPSRSFATSPRFMAAAEAAPAHSTNFYLKTPSVSSDRQHKLAAAVLLSSDDFSLQIALEDWKIIFTATGVSFRSQN